MKRRNSAWFAQVGLAVILLGVCVSPIHGVSADSAPAGDGGTDPPAIELSVADPDVPVGDLTLPTAPDAGVSTVEGGRVHASAYRGDQGGQRVWAQSCDVPQTLDVQVPEEAVYETVWITATAAPPTVTLPLTFTWYLPGQAPEVHVISGTESATQLPATVKGTHVLTVTAQNCGGVVTATTEVEIVDPPRPDLVLLDLWKEGGSLGYQIMNRGPVTATAGHLVQFLVDGTFVGNATVTRDLGPGVRMNAKFAYAWTCSGRSDTIEAIADRGGIIDESNESNNTRQEVWTCDTSPPVFTWGPTVTLVTENSAVIEWETDEDSTGEVQYSVVPKLFNRSASHSGTATHHTVTVTGLAPARTYQYRVESVDAEGLRSVSRAYWIETPVTAAPFPPEPPVFEAIKVPRSDNYVLRITYEGASSMGAQALDPSRDIERVEFFIDGVPVRTAYEGSNGSYEVVLSPYTLGWKGRTFYDTAHTVTTKVWSWAKVGQINPYIFEPQRDSIPVDVAITFPPSGWIVYTDQDTVPAGERIDIFVEAKEYDWQCTWNGGATPLRGVAPDCGDVAYAVESVQFLVDNQIQHTSYPSSDQDFWHGWTFELGGLSPYARTVRVRAIDSDGEAHQTEATINIVKVEYEPAINVTRNIVREGNVFRVQLTVENDAAATGWAHVRQIRDYVEGFQVVPTPGSNYTIDSYYGYYMGSQERVNGIFINFSTPLGDYILLDPGQSVTVEYVLVPVLYDPYVDFGIGGAGRDVKVYYETPAGEEEMRAYDLRAWLLQYEAQQAVGTADYLLVTRPHKLASHYGGEGMNAVLGEMARLAALKNGVLGFLQYDNTRDDLDALVAWGGAWAEQLTPAFQLWGQGYMLIVGEVEIVDAFYLDGFELKWNGGGGTDFVNYSDHPYADTYGGGRPDLIVGRLIGDSAQELVNAMQTSINVHLGTAGYSYDTSHAALFSGTGGSMGDFQDNVDSIHATLMSEGVASTKTHWGDSAILASYGWDFEQHDAFAAGDVDGDGDDELIIADRGDRIHIVNENGVLVRDFAVDFGAGDTLAVGDMNGDGVDEIVIGDQDNYVEFYDQWGTKVHWFSLNLNQYDDLAVGNVTGDAQKEIVLGDRDDRIAVYDLSGALVAEFGLTYGKHDGLAVGNVNGVGLDEIVVARQGFAEVWAYDVNGTQVVSFSHKYEEGHVLAIGDVTADAGQEVLVGKQNGILVFAYDSAKQELVRKRTIPAHWESFDGVAVREWAGTNEVWWASRLDYLRHLDPNFQTQALLDVDNVTRGADLIYFSGHGNTDVWGPVLGSGDFPIDLGNTNPFVLAPTCLSGNYQDRGDQGIAETFLAQGAGVYIGSTEISAISGNCAAGKLFFENWDPSKTVGRAFLDLERERWDKGTIDWWEFWVTEYNLYGDPKFGDPSAISASAAAAMMAAQQTPPPSLTLTLPDYVVSPRADGYVNVDIPGSGGDLILDQGAYRIPYWSFEIEYPQGQRVQGLTVTRTAPITDSLALTTTQMVAASASLANLVPQTNIPPGSDAWTPDQEQVYVWHVVDNPGGSSTLVIELYPFHYQPLTQKVVYYKQFEIAIETITSTVSIERLALDKAAYDPGESVSVTLWLSNTGAAQDVILEAVVRDRASGEYVDGLPIRILYDLSGSTVHAMAWDSSAVEAGSYDLEVALRDGEGNLLAQTQQGLRLGIVSGEVTAFSATPGLFQVGGTVDLSLTFSSTGSAPLTGTAYIEVQTADGATTVATYAHAVENLAPGSAVTLEDAWDTSGATEETYRAIGYVLYESQSTPIEEVTVSTRAYLYLPILMRNR